MAAADVIRKELAVEGKTIDNDKENLKNKRLHIRNNILK